MTTSAIDLLVVNRQFFGWYEAPSPFGRTDFELTIDSVGEGGDFEGTGRDKHGEFTVRGTALGDKITFTKDYKDGSTVGSGDDNALVVMMITAMVMMTMMNDVDNYGGDDNNFE